MSKRRKVERTTKSYTLIEMCVERLIFETDWSAIFPHKHYDSQMTWDQNIEMLKRCSTQRLENVLCEKRIKCLRSLTTVKSRRKRDLANAIACEFHGKTCALDVRNIEERILETNPQFGLTLCGRYLPPEMARHIMDYCVHDLDLLYGVGKTNKEFYVLVLATWKSITITRENLKRISLLVLANARRVTLDDVGGFTKGELGYLYKNLKREESLMLRTGIYSNVGDWFRPDVEGGFYERFQYVKELGIERFTIDLERFENVQRLAIHDIFSIAKIPKNFVEIVFVRALKFDGCVICGVDKKVTFIECGEDFSISIINQESVSHVVLDVGNKYSDYLCVREGLLCCMQYEMPPLLKKFTKWIKDGKRIQLNSNSFLWDSSKKNFR